MSKLTIVAHVYAESDKVDFVKDELLKLLREKAEKSVRDEFAWKIFQYWQDDGCPSKEKWAMGALGHLGDDGCVLKLTPMM